MSNPATDRLEQSRKVLTAWETMGQPSDIEGHLQVITAEIITLNNLVSAYPEHDEEVLDLMERYMALVEQLKARTH